MRLDAIAIGNNPPHDVNVVIEVPNGGEPIKYELDKASGTLVVDRFLYTPMRYPGNYGFVPHTLSADGDPIDVLVCNTRAIIPGAVMNCRPVGVLVMEDEGGGDEKIIAVPSSQAHQALRQGEELYRPAATSPCSRSSTSSPTTRISSRTSGPRSITGAMPPRPPSHRRGDRARQGSCQVAPDNKSPRPAIARPQRVV